MASDDLETCEARCELCKKLLAVLELPEKDCPAAYCPRCWKKNKEANERLQAEARTERRKREKGAPWE